MSKYGVRPDTEEALEREMTRLGIREQDIEEKFIKGGGPGGQKINKSASCVYLQHLPSGIEVKCQKTRSLAQNRFHARRELCFKMDSMLRGAASLRQQTAEKIRRQKRRRSRKAKNKMLANKAHRSQVKSARGRVGSSDY